MKPTRTWILIADASRAKVLLKAGKGNGLTVIAGMTMARDHKRASEIGADKPGRSFESVGATRHAIAPRSDPERIEEQRFAGRIIERLEAEAGQDSYDQLVLVAPPVMLGDLRAALTPHLSHRLVATLDKDLTKTPAAKLGSLLEDVLPL